MTPESEPDPWSLQAGIDAERWSSTVRDATAELRQGDLIPAPPLVYAANAEHPLHFITVQWASSDKASTGAVNVTNVAKRSPYGIIVTQTCDLVEEGKPKRPWIHVAPVYQLKCDAGSRGMIERERGFPYLCPIQTLEPFDDGLWVADLRLLIPLEKGCLVGATVTPAFSNDAGGERLSRQLAAVFSRPAYPTALIECLLKPLDQLLHEITKEHGGQDPIATVGLALGRSRLDPSTAEVVFLLDAPLGDDLRDQILNWGREVADNAPEGLEVLVPRMTSFNDLSAREYRQLMIYDVSEFSRADEGA